MRFFFWVIYPVMVLSLLVWCGVCFGVVCDGSVWPIPTECFDDSHAFIIGSGVDSRDSVRLGPGASLFFSDGSSLSTAPVVPPGAEMSASMVVLHRDPEMLLDWFQQGNVWTSFFPSYQVGFSKVCSSSSLRVHWTDNVGVYGASWCNIGLFLDNSEVPLCAGSWSGSPDTTMFNQQSIDCVVPLVLQGPHVVSVKHRSQYCVYGNYAFDYSGVSRYISVQEVY